MKCQRCGSQRVATVMSHCSDCFAVDLVEYRYDGYVPYDLGIGSGDQVGFNYCLDCGQIQGKFPLIRTLLESADDE